MKRVVFMAFLILLATSFSASAVEFVGDDGSSSDVPSFVGYAPNRIVVNFDPSTLRGLDRAAMARGKTGISALDHVGSRHGVISLRPQFPGAMKKSYKGKVIDLAGWHKVKFSRGADVLAVVEEYKAIPGVIDAQPVGIHRVADRYPNDEAYADWGTYQWQLNKIQAPKAWDIERGNPAIIVAVLDTGVRYYHGDLGGPGVTWLTPNLANGNMWINPDEIFGDGIDNDNNGFVDDRIGGDWVNDPCGEPYMGLCIPCCCYSNGNLQEDCLEPDNDPRDFNGHGTHCAGNVSAITNNNFAAASLSGGYGNGVFSKSPGDGVKVMALRIGWHAFYVFPGMEAGMVAMDYAAEAMVFAADKGAKMVSCSWESDSSGGIEAATQYFRSSGGLIFKAAGNGYAETPDTICNFEDPDNQIICVAATDQYDCKADFSNYGSWIDISAPGVDVGSLYHVYSDDRNDYLIPMSGTSMSTPLAASVAALIWSQDKDQSAIDVKDKLLASADSIDELPCNTSLNLRGKLGAGRINAYQAVLGGVPSPACTDADSDGYYAEGGDCGPVDCDDTDPAINPGASEICGDTEDNDCDGLIDSNDPDCSTPPVCTDVDGDGYNIEGGDCGAVDCNDADPAINPGAIEICGDGIDQDCSGSDLICTDPNDVDDDGDGYTENQGDCDDTDPQVFPGAFDYCKNGIDEDCDGFDRDKGKGCNDGGGNGGVKEICDNGIDDDGDGKTDCADKKDCGKDPACP